MNPPEFGTHNVRFFPGVHSDIGGHKDMNFVIGDYTLRWMIDQANSMSHDGKIFSDSIDRWREVIGPGFTNDMKIHQETHLVDSDLYGIKYKLEDRKWPQLQKVSTSY